MTNEDAARRLDEVEALALRAREEGRELSPWIVIQVCEGRAHILGPVPPLPHDRPDQQAG